MDGNMQKWQLESFRWPFVTYSLDRKKTYEFELNQMNVFGTTLD